MTVNDALQWGRKFLSSRGVDSCFLDAEVLLTHILNWDKEKLYAHSERMLSAEESSIYGELLRRRGEYVPVAYLTGCKEFFSLDFEVQEGVMIPRPETEILVEKVIEKFSLGQEGYKPPLIVDIGTGCGNIAITLAKSLKSTVYATDISSEAIKIASRNANRLGTFASIIFLEGNLFEPLRGRGLEEKVDLLVSNPPYISAEDIDYLAPEISCYEPRIAFDGGNDGLKFYPLIIQGAKDFLKPGGYLVLEMGYGQARKVERIFLQEGGFSPPEVVPDCRGIPRFIWGRRK